MEVTGPVNEAPADGQAATHLLDAVTLACGAEIDPLLEQVADGRAADRDAHQRDCVHCQAAIAEFTALWAPVAETAATPVPVPPGLTAAVMSQIRVQIRDVWYTVQTTEDGVIRIAARIVAALARDSARMIPGVRVALVPSIHGIRFATERATFQHRHPHAAVGVLGRTAVVDLAVAVTYGDPVHEVARDIQRQVIATLRDHIGLKTVAVNVIVDDVLIDEDQLPGTPGRRDQVAFQRTRGGFLPWPRRRAAAITSRTGQFGRLTTTTLGGVRGACSVSKARMPAMNAPASPPRSGWCARMNCLRRRSVSFTQPSPAPPPPHHHITLRRKAVDAACAGHRQI
jgi:uncharacterized alkaline shock family protein YloU